MPIPQESICADIEQRVAKARQGMVERGYQALIVYGNNKVYGSLRYLTDYFPDRAGWISFSGTETYLYDGAAFVLPAEGEPSLVLDPGLMPGKDICTARLVAGGIASGRDDALSARKLVDLLGEVGATEKVGIETWDRFPTPLYIGLTELMPKLTLERSTIVEELRMVKTPLEVANFRKAAEIGDLGHRVFADALRKNGGKTELELARLAEHTMRSADPIYEDSVSNSPSLLCSGTKLAGSLLHLPDHKKTIQQGDAVHWDICERHNGYAIDTSRTKVFGKPTPEQQRAHDTTVLALEEVRKAARPGVKAVELVRLAQKVTRDAGYELWGDFLGHGIGFDAHERPDLVREETLLAENMVLAIEPRVVIDDKYILGLEDMVLVTESGGEALNKFDSSLDL